MGIQADTLNIEIMPLHLTSLSKIHRTLKDLLCGICMKAAKKGYFSYMFFLLHIEIPIALVTTYFLDKYLIKWDKHPLYSSPDRKVLIKNLLFKIFYIKENGFLKFL